jgi:hypothetical protein
MFELFMASINGRLLLVELRCHLRLCRDQLTTSFRVAFDHYFRGFRELVAFRDDGLGLISDSIILLALSGHGLLSELGKPLIGCSTAPDDSGNQQSQVHCDSTKLFQLLQGHFSIG